MDKELHRKRRTYLAKNTLLFALGNAGTKLISFILVPLYTLVLTPEEYGLIDIILSVVTIVVPIATLNISEAVLRFLQDKHADQEKIIRVGFFSMVGAAAGAFIASLGVLFVEDLRQYAWRICFYILTTACSQLLLSTLRGKELLLSYSLGNILQAFLVAVLNVALVAIWHLGISGYLLAYILANTLTSVYAFFAGKFSFSPGRTSLDASLLRKMVHYSAPLIPATFLWWIINSSDRIMISALIGVDANGIYSVSCKIPTLITTFATVFNVAWSYSAIKEKDSADSREYSNTMYDGVVMASLSIGAGLLTVLKPFLSVYVSPEYISSWKYVPPLIVGVVFLSLGSFLATSYTVHKDSTGFLKSAAIGALSNILLNAIFIPSFGVMGAAFATGISHIAVCIFRAADTQKYMHIPVFKKEHLLAYALLAVMTISVYINGPGGYAVLAVEFVAMLLLFKKQWIELIFEIVKKGKWHG